MPNFLPYLIVLIFTTSQIGFLILLRRQQQALDDLWDALLDHDEYARTQDRTYAKLWKALQSILKEIHKTLHLHDQLARHDAEMRTVAEEALHSKVDRLANRVEDQLRYEEYLDTRLTVVLDEVCRHAALQDTPKQPEISPRKTVAPVKRSKKHAPKK
jgi:hypothetical protein